MIRTGSCELENTQKIYSFMRDTLRASVSISCTCGVSLNQIKVQSKKQFLEVGLSKCRLEINGRFFTAQVTRGVGDSPFLEVKPSYLKINAFCRS